MEELEADVAASVLRAADGTADPAAVLRRGAQAFLDACLDPAFQRIVLLDPPSVLGWETWRDIDERHGLGLVTAGLEAVMDAGLMTRRPPLAHLLLGALSEAGMLLATAKRPKAVRREIGETIDWLLDRVLV